MKLLKTKIALVAASVTFASAVSAADVTINPTLEVSNALTLTQVAGSALSFGRIRALASDVATDCSALFIPANTTSQPTTVIPANVSGTAFANPCAAKSAAALSILSPLADLTVASFEVADAAPYTALTINVDHTADIASPDPTAAVFVVNAVDVYKTATPGITAAPVNMTRTGRESAGLISTGEFGTVSFNLGALITTEIVADADVTQFIDAVYTGSINVEVDY